MERPDSHPNISVLDPITPAVERVRSLLFAPFAFGRWLAVGFAAWLAVLGRQETANGVGYLAGKLRRSGGVEDLARQTQQWLIDAPATLLKGMVLGVAAFVLFGLLGLWLSSRGRFILLNCVARNTCRLAGAWRESAAQANSLFLFRLCLGMLGCAVFVLPIAVILIQTYHLLGAQSLQHERVLVIAACAVGCLILLAGVLLIGKLTNDFVVPVMYRHKINVLAAWGRTASMLGSAIGAAVGYVLFQILLQTIIGAIGVIALLATCGIAAVPYVGTVLLLPLIVFDRAYSICFLEQFGEESRSIRKP